MNTCIYCGEEIYQGCETCPNCGMKQPSVAPVAPVRRWHWVKPVLLTLAALIVVAAVAFGLIFLLSGKGSLSSAAIRSVDELSDSIGSRSGGGLIAPELGKAIKKGKFSSSVDLSMEDAAVSAELQCSIPGRKFAGNGTIRIDDLGLQTSIRFFADRKHLEFSFPNGSGSVYGLPLDKLSGGGALGSLFSQNSLADVFGDKGPFSGLSRKLKALTSDAEIEKLGKQTVLVDGNEYRWKAYTVSWDSSSRGGSRGSGSSLLDTLLSVESPMTCYVDGGKLVGLRFDLLGNRCLLTMLGGRNIWDDVRLSVQTAAGGEKKFVGQRMSSGNDAAFVLQGTDSVFLRIDHNNADGRTSIWLDGLGYIFDGIYQSQKDRLSFAVALPEGANDTLALSIEKPDGAPEKLARKYVDLRDMSKAQMLSLLSDLGLNPLQALLG